VPAYLIYLQVLTTPGSLLPHPQPQDAPCDLTGDHLTWILMFFTVTTVTSAPQFQMFEIPVCLLGNITAGDILRVMEEASKTREMPASVGCKESQQQHYNMKSCALATLAPNGNLSRTDTASCLKLSLHTHHLHEVDRHTGQCQTKLSTVLLTHLQGTRCLHDAAHRQITEARIWQVANTP
jgi:hypothetical protein